MRAGAERRRNGAGRCRPRRRKSRPRSPALSRGTARPSCCAATRAECEGPGRGPPPGFVGLSHLRTLLGNRTLKFGHVFRHRHVPETPAGTCLTRPKKTPPRVAAPFPTPFRRSPCGFGPIFNVWFWSRPIFTANRNPSLGGASKRSRKRDRRKGPFEGGPSKRARGVMMKPRRGPSKRTNQRPEEKGPSPRNCLKGT
ncbi:hypothetical protein M885DRAFT_32495 [Pelagophyceae sp. CCMP2097]|nr:hypothetical protein M885DRAFT_32495 [Pelagophyceae sp. CCMP2097]